jgi:outer membrane protein assembly factor BamB
VNQRSEHGPALRSARAPLLGFFLALSTASACTCSTRVQHVTGEGAANPGSLDFGTVTLGQTARQTFVLQNVGAAPLAIFQTSFTGTNPTDFTLPVAIAGRILQPADSLTVEISFGPGDAGARQGTLQIDTDSTTMASVLVALVGNGIDIQLCPATSAIDFGPVQIHGAPATRQLVINNCGRSPADLSLGGVEGAQAGDFSLTGATSATLQPGQAFTIAVNYAPSAVGPSSADVPFRACAACSASAPISLSGTGVDGALTFNPSPVAFAAVNVGQASTATAAAINSGTATIQITSLKIRASPSPFAIVSPPALPASLAPGAMLVLALKFTAPAGGASAAELDATYTVADPTVASRSATDHLIGTGDITPCALAISPASVAFGNVAINSSAKRTVALTNSGGTACSVTGIAIAAGSNAFFALTPPVSTTATVPAFGSANISVSFSPTSSLASGATGNLVFQTSDPANASATLPLTASTALTPYAAGWPKWHFDNFNTGQTQADTSALTGAVAWKYSVGKPVNRTYMESPVVDAAGTVYFENQAGALTAVNASGAKSWSTALSDPSGDPHPSTPVLLADGSIFAISGEEQASHPDLYLLSPAGAIKYSATFGIEGFSSTPGFGNDGTLFIADDDGIPGNGAPDDPADVMAFNISSGKVVLNKGYKIPFTLGISSGERLSVVINGDDTSYWTTGVEIAALKPPAQGFAPLAGWPSGVVKFMAEPMNAYDLVSDLAMDPSPGGYLFAYAGFGMTNSSGTIEVGGALVGIDPATGSKKWTLSLPTTALPTGWSGTQADYGNGSPAVASNGTVYVGNSDGLRAVNGHTGAVVWHFSSANVTDAAAIGGDGTIFFGTQDGTFYALHPDGTLRFSVKANGQIASAPAIASNGTVYFVSDDGYLYALK